MYIPQLIVSESLFDGVDIEPNTAAGQDGQEAFFKLLDRLEGDGYAEDLTLLNEYSQLIRVGLPSLAEEPIQTLRASRRDFDEWLYDYIVENEFALNIQASEPSNA